MKKQAHGGKSAADGARSWCPAIPVETPTAPGRRLMNGPADSRSMLPLLKATKVSMDRLL